MKTQTGLDNDTMHRMLAEGLEYSDAPESDKAVMAWLNVYGRRFSHVIGGVMEVPGTHDKLFDVINPATEEGLAQTKIGTPDDVEAMKQSLSAFHRSHELLYGHSTPTEPVEMVNIRVSGRGIVSKPSFNGRGGLPPNRGLSSRGKRRVFFGGKFAET